MPLVPQAAALSVAVEADCVAGTGGADGHRCLHTEPSVALPLFRRQRRLWRVFQMHPGLTPPQD